MSHPRMGKGYRTMKNKKRFLIVLSSLLLAGSLLAGCGTPTAAPTNGSALSGAIEIDGSSTVYPISEAMGEEFSKIHSDVKLTIGVSGTGGGFKRFVAGETDISNASRPIKDSEKETAQANGIEFVELNVAIDGLTVVVNPENDWADDMTVEQLNLIWKAGGATRWSDVDPSWPAEPIVLYAPGTDSGTYDYFTEVVLGDDEGRTDFTASEDDNVLVQGVVGDKYALAYFGYSYYTENTGTLKAVAIGGVLPSDRTVGDGTYSPLSRPLFIYVKKASYAEKPQVKAFVDFMLENGPALVPSTGYIPLSEAQYQEQLAKLG